MLQQEFLNMEAPHEGMPRTRYQGSKRKLLPWLFEVFSEQTFQSCLDLFGGTGSVSHVLRFMEKKVHYNDILPSNAIIAEALFANEDIALKEAELRQLFDRTGDTGPGATIAEHFQGVYFTDEENMELDILCQNIPLLASRVARAEAYYCLFQAALSKRPYNLFHRANLEMRFRDVKRGFGNKATWDKTFLDHMLKFYHELRDYRLRRAKYPVKVTCQDAFTLGGSYDLVYIDTPYAKSHGPQESNYFNFYHFLDGILEYETLGERLLAQYAHKPIYPPGKRWYPHESITDAFAALAGVFPESTKVISYRSDGCPSPDELVEMLRPVHTSVEVVHSGDYKYALASKASNTAEIVIVAK